MKNKLATILGLFLIYITTTINAVAAETADQAQSITLGQVFAWGGWVLWLLVAISIFTLAIMIYLIVVHRAEVIVPKALSRLVLENIRNKQFVEARTLCDEKPCAYSSVAEVAISSVLSNSKIDKQSLETVVTAEGERQASKINGMAQWLLDISAIAPMIGLFGTVLGMLHTFLAICSSETQIRTEYLAAGVSKALVTTIAGLCIAIPAMICYAFVRRRAEKRISELERASNDVVSAIIQG